REPLSRALRGRPFDHEEFMEILYPDVIGSGGAPKRIMKPRRRTDGLPADDSEMPDTGVSSSQPESSNISTSHDSPGPAARSSSSLTPTASGTSAGGVPPPNKPTWTMAAPLTAPPQQSALTPPDEPTHQAKKRALSVSQGDEGSGTTSPPQIVHSGATLLSVGSPEKKQRTSIAVDSAADVPVAVPVPVPVPVPAPALALALAPASSSSRLCDAAVSPSAHGAPAVMAMTQSPSETPVDVGGGSTSEAAGPSPVTRWCELALEQFFRDFAAESMDLQIKIAEHVLIHESKALVYCKMPWRVKQYWVKKLEDALRDMP
ncbi:hypothetical protein E4U43_005879, partial [Claviceps pusilla]